MSIDDIKISEKVNLFFDDSEDADPYKDINNAYPIDIDKKIGMKAIAVANKIIGEDLESRVEKVAMDFNVYKELCNKNNDGSRARGILSEECYQYIINDQTTDFVDVENQRIPVLIDAKYGLGMGYDELKCREYAENLSAVKILALPIHELSPEGKAQLGKILTSYDKLALYFGDHNKNESDCLAEILNTSNITYSETFLIDNRVKKAEDGQASLYLYSCRVENSVEANNSKVMLSDVKKCYDNQSTIDCSGNRYAGPVYSTYVKKDEKTGELVNIETKTVLEMGNEITPEKAQKIWDLYNSIFDELGKGKHPISMQDGIDEFMGLLKSENTMLAATYEKSETNDFDNPVCFTYFVDDMSKLYWLNEEYLQKYSDNNDTFLFTPGIVSSAIGTSLSHLPIELFTKAGCEAGMNACIFFENTNFSKEYVPLLVNRYISRTCEKLNSGINFTKSELMDQVSYKLWLLSGV